MKALKTTLCVLFLFTTTLMAQNPFTVKSNVIIDFNISHDGKMMVYKQLSSDATSTVFIKDLETGRVTSIYKNSLKDYSEFDASSGVDFLSDNVIVFGKEKNMVSFNLLQIRNIRIFSDCLTMSFFLLKHLLMVKEYISVRMKQCTLLQLSVALLQKPMKREV